MFTILFTLIFLYMILAFCKFVGERLIAYKNIQTVVLPELFNAVDEVMDKSIYRSVGAEINYGSMTMRQLREICKGNPKYKGYSEHCKNKRKLAAFVKMTDLISQGFDPIIAFECRYDF